MWVFLREDPCYMEQFKQLLEIVGINFVTRISRMVSQVCMYSLMYSTLPRRLKFATEVCSCLGKNYWF